MFVAIFVSYITFSMRNIPGLLFFFCISSYQLMAQIFPTEGSSVNYRLIGFSFPLPADGNCRLEVAAGNINTEDSFKINIIFSKDCKNNKIIAEVPAFGRQYTWRVVSADNKQIKNNFNHFSTGIIPNVDTSKRRLRVLKKAEAYKDGYVFIDGTRVLYDMNGNPVWFLPNIEHFTNDNFEVRDMKLTPQGTVTFIIGENAYEVDYNAAILWKAPNNGAVSGGKSELYHHKITRLANGHYMVLGNEIDFWNPQFLSVKDSSYAISRDNKNRNLSVPFGTVIEYDEKGNIIWSWKSRDYFKSSDIYYHKGRGGVADIVPHENAFYFDENAKVIYVSFRNISRIVKVKYPEGNVLSTYGEIFEPNNPEKGNGLFCHQHSCGISEQGYLYLFNNNICNEGAPPSVLMMQEPVSGKGGLKKIWEYECPIDGVNDTSIHPKYIFSSGGNVAELPDHSFFVSMCANFYSKVFIVSKDKNVLWSAIPETKNEATEKWGMTSFYEANIIKSPKLLENFIWHK